jgi:hypothetical protein
VAWGVRRGESWAPRRSDFSGERRLDWIKIGMVSRSMRRSWTTACYSSANNSASASSRRTVGTPRRASIIRQNSGELSRRRSSSSLCAMPVTTANGTPSRVTRMRSCCASSSTACVSHKNRSRLVSFRTAPFERSRAQRTPVVELPSLEVTAAPEIEPFSSEPVDYLGTDNARSWGVARRDISRSFHQSRSPPSSGPCFR